MTYVFIFLSDRSKLIKKAAVARPPVFRPEMLLVHLFSDLRCNCDVLK